MLRVPRQHGLLQHVLDTQAPSRCCREEKSAPSKQPTPAAAESEAQATPRRRTPRDPLADRSFEKMLLKVLLCTVLLHVNMSCNKIHIWPSTAYLATYIRDYTSVGRTPAK